MGDTKNDRLTKKSVQTAIDTGMDAQRQYANSLFNEAATRIAALRKQNEEVEAKLKNAMTVIRPDNDGGFALRMPYIPNQNDQCLETLKRAITSAIAHYELCTGFRVRNVYIGHTEEKGVVVKTLVHNV